MERVGVFEAKTRLAQLLRRVEAGERFVITRHDRPVAELVPATGRDSAAIESAIEHLEEFQRTHSLDGVSIRDLIVEGRRY